MVSNNQRCEVAVQGLPPSWSKQEVEALFTFGRLSANDGEVERVVWPISAARCGDATIVFDSTKNAGLAIEELDGLDLDHEGGGVLSLKIMKATIRPTCAPHLAAASRAPEKATSQPTGNAAGELDDLEDVSSMVQLRGLPFRAKVVDIESFLGEHARNLAIDEEPAIRLLLNRDGRPSGFARVRFDSPDAAKACCCSLHRHEMDDRYIEVLPYDRNDKAARRARRFVALDAGTETGDIVDPESEVVNQEQLLQEVRSYLSGPGRRQSLLSMVGCALSPESRAYLSRVGLGVKHVLMSFPEEFHVEGNKGSEQVTLHSGERDRPPHKIAPSRRPTEPSVETGANDMKVQYMPQPLVAVKRSHAHLNTEEHPGAQIGQEVPMVRLRGLPFTVSAKEVSEWIAEHHIDDLIADVSDAVQLLNKANGKPSGQAVVQIRSHDDAKEIQEVLNNQLLGDRYIEVFAYGGDSSSTDYPKRRRKINRSR